MDRRRRADSRGVRVERGFRRLRSRFYVGKVSINFAGHRVELHPNSDVIQIAHCAWVELSTRKAGLPFDPDNDVIADIYSSWYELFREMRKLASSCPVGRVVDNRDTQRSSISLLTFERWSPAAPHEMASAFSEMV